MTVPQSQLPLTIAGRSLVDSIRIRWGGAGAVGLGLLALFSGSAAGIFFGVLLLGLGVATWALSGFGSRWWYDIPTPQRYIVGTGAVIGMLAFSLIILSFFVISWILTMLANS